MTYKTDGGGVAFKCNDAKLQASASTWATKLSQLGKQKGAVHIITYSLPDMRYVSKQLERRPYNIWLIAHSKFKDRAIDIKKAFPNVMVAVCDYVHSKVLLIAPNTIVISSANFGSSHWHETSVSFHSKDAHDYYYKNSFVPLWKACIKVV